MAPRIAQKRARDDVPKSKGSRPSKKQRKIQQYNSDLEDDDEEIFQAVNLADSDDDVSQAAKILKDDSPAPAVSLRISNDAKPGNLQIANPGSSSGDDSGSSSEAGSNEESGSDVDDDEIGDEQTKAESGTAAKPKSKSKRNDPNAFATSMSKILNTKLSTTRRVDPVLARSADAAEASRRVVDAALEDKARKQLREQKRLALEKGRVRDVLVPSGGSSSLNLDGHETGTLDVDDNRKETTTQILAREKRFEKTARKAVVMLFNAFRAAQVKAAEAERVAQAGGAGGMERRKQKVTEMSRQGFLDLLASGGGGLKKGGLEEA